MIQYIECGKIVATHGIKGELKVLPWVDDPHFLLQFRTLYLDSQGCVPLHLTHARIHKNMLLLQTAQCATPEAAAHYRGKTLYLNRDDDPDKTPYLIDYMGVVVTNADTGKCYGTITDVLRTGANDVYTIQDDMGKERLIPDIPTVVLHTDLPLKKMQIRPLKGLFEDEN